MERVWFIKDAAEWYTNSIHKKKDKLIYLHKLIKWLKKPDPDVLEGHRSLKKQWVV